MDNLLNVPLATLLEHSNSLGIAICDFEINENQAISKLHCVYANEKFAQSVLLPLEVILNQDLNSIDDYDIISTINSLEIPPFYIKDNNFYKFEFIRPTKDYNKIIILMQCVSSHITKYKKELVQQLQEQFYNFANNNNVPMMISNLRDSLYFNEAYVKLFGYSSKEELSKVSTKDLSPLYQDNGALSSELLAHYKKETISKGHCHFEWIHYKKDKSLLYLEIHMNYMEINGEGLLNASLKDLTEKRKFEAEARIEQEKLLDSMSVPIMPIFKDIILVSLSGTLTENRANLAGRLSLQKVAEMQSRVVIVDVSGVEAASLQVAVMNLLRLAGGAYLMGCSTILSGLSPDLARGIVELGVNIDGVIATANLEGALKTAIKMIYN